MVKIKGGRSKEKVIETKEDDKVVVMMRELRNLSEQVGLSIDQLADLMDGKSRSTSNTLIGAVRLQTQNQNSEAKESGMKGVGLHLGLKNHRRLRRTHKRR